jgi:hypothetical protein
MSSFPFRAADEGSQTASIDAAGSDDAFGYSRVDRDGVAGPRLVIAREHVTGDREDHSGVGGGYHGVRHRAHRTALHAAVVISRGRVRIFHPVLSVHRVMVVFTVSDGLIVMARNEGTVLAASCNGGRQLQPGALSPSGSAGDKRERDGQDQDMVKNATHAVMLAGPVENRQRIWRHTRQCNHGEVEPFLSLVLDASDNEWRASNLSQCAAISFKRLAS